MYVETDERCTCDELDRLLKEEPSLLILAKAACKKDLIGQGEMVCFVRALKFLSEVREGISDERAGDLCTGRGIYLKYFTSVKPDINTRFPPKILKLAIRLANSVCDDGTEFFMRRDLQDGKTTVVGVRLNREKKIEMRYE